MKNEYCKLERTNGTYELLGFLSVVLLLVLSGCSGNSDKTEKSKKNEITPADFVEKTSDLNLSMVYVEGGEFSMGATAEQGSDASSNEKPVRSVKVNSFYIGKYEITKDQWYKIMGEEDPSAVVPTEEDKDMPAENITWAKAKKFCEKLSKVTGRKYCMPTEAQWEYAARGGKNNDGTKYSGSNSLDSVACYNDPKDKCLHKIGTKNPNSLGVYDMSGNVWEWCSDRYGEYDSSDLDNPKGSMTDNGLYVRRGGSWCSFKNECRVSARSFDIDENSFYDFGFRVAMIP